MQIKKNTWEKPAHETRDPEVVTTFFGPPDSELRFRFVVSKEEGEKISLVPGEQKFKKGLTALRWSAEQGGTSTTYVVDKVTPSRIDLTRRAEKPAPTA